MGSTTTRSIVGTVSRLGEHRKGIHHFLDMAVNVAAIHPTARILVVGDGPLRSELEQQARRVGIESSVVFTGKRRYVSRLLTAMQVFVIPSLSEGGPYTVLEEMAMMKPVVATPVGLVPDVVEHRATGLLVPLADSAALTGAVLELLADAELAGQLAERGREAVVERFSLDAMIAGVTAVYREVA
jgi:glycosyltransferase involved in cell wall biosynthesis